VSSQPSPGDTLAPDAATADRAMRLFAAAFGRAPRWLAAAPGRVNLIGEHTDYNAGLVLPAAIDRWCVAAAAPAAGPTGRLVSADVEGGAAPVPYTLDHADAVPLPTWARYAAGTLWTLAATHDPDAPPLDVAVASGVPLGGGLSSSAALEVSVARVAAAAWGLELPLRALAEAGQIAERTFAGVPCGVMDQLASSLGVEGSALLIDCESGDLSPVPLPHGAELVVINSRVRHALASGEYAARRAACERTARALGVPSLRHADRAAIERSTVLSDDERRCARHVVAENARVLDFAGALRAADLPGAGRLMIASHVSLRDDFRVSCPELDFIVDAVARLPGVHGVRMTGAGFGGCAVALTTPGAGDRVRDALAGPYQRRFGLACSAETVRAVGGARLL
jgi:galactokinase